MNTRPHNSIALRLFALVGIAIVASCGGVGSGGTGSEFTLSNGTVTGFGSVIVDGTRFDDQAAPIVTEIEPGKDVGAEILLGHRVEVVSAVAGVAKTVRVEAAVVGTVSAVQVGSFQVLGQTVLINKDASLGPVTQFGGYALATDVRPGDAVEVHGVHQIVANADVVQATRVEQRAALPSYLRVSGLLRALGASADKQFTLGTLVVDYASSTIEPAGVNLANGVPVVVLATPARLVTQPDGSLRLNAAALRVKSVRSDGIDTYASGVIAQLDAAAGRFKLNGLTVSFSATGVSPAGGMLADGLYVQARGMVAADGLLVASLVTVRDGKNHPEVELKGTLSGFDSAANTFLVRDVLVRVSATTKLEECPATGLVNGLFVEVEGAMSVNGVTAKEIHCKNEPSGAVIEREGIASAVDTTTSTFTLTPAGSPTIPVRWTASTYFGSVTPQTLNGMKVVVEGVLVNGVLQASKIKLDP